MSELHSRFESPSRVHASKGACVRLKGMKVDKEGQWVQFTTPVRLGLEQGHIRLADFPITLTHLSGVSPPVSRRRPPYCRDARVVRSLRDAA